jgi:hypothetical protein
MLTEHQHPKSSVLVTGMRLAQGAVLREDDVYDSTSGTWERCPAPGLVLGSTPTVWVRPTGLSQEGLLLLAYLAERKYLLTKPLHESYWRWKMIPSPGWKNDGRMDWPVQHPQCVQDLIEFGFITPTKDDEIYEVSDAGRAAAQQLAA